MSAFHANSPQIHSYTTNGAVPKIVSQSRANYIRVLQRLRELGVRKFGFKWSEVRYLPQLIHPTEQVGGVVQGRSKDGHVLLAATDKRVIFLDTKPLFVRSEDISYDAISALTLEWMGVSGALTMHTRLGDFKLKINNRRTAEIFRSFVEQRCIERNRTRY